MNDLRPLRRQLIELLDQARRQQRLPAPAPRLAAALVHDFTRLLAEPERTRTAMRWRLVSREHLHRHVITIRCPDQAFYLDAIKGYFVRQGIQPLEQQTMVLHLKCDAAGCITRLAPPEGGETGHFMFIAVHVSATLAPDGARIARDLDAVLRAVDASVRDFPAMLAQLRQAAKAIEASNAEAAELLRWMIADRYLFFGLRVASLAPEDGERRLGLFRNRRVLKRVARGLADDLAALPPRDEPGLEWLHLPASQHYLYSAAALEVVRIVWTSGKSSGKQVREAILLGHFSRSARYANASAAPVLRERWGRLLETPMLRHSAFYRREIRTIFDRLPKPLLLATPIQDWMRPLKQMADLTGPLQTGTAIFTPAPGIMRVVLASIPADRFGPNVARQITARLREHGMEAQGRDSIGIGNRRLLIIPCLCEQEPDARAIARAVQESVIFWKDRAKAQVLARARRLDVPDMLARLERLPPIYQELFPPEQFITDMRALDWVREHRRTRVHVRKAADGVEIHIFTARPQPLGNLVATIQNFGLTAMSEAVVRFDEEDETLYLSSLQCAHDAPITPEDIGRLSLALDHVLNDEADDEPVNELTLTAALDISQVAVIITLRNHLVQLMPDAAPLMLTRMLRAHPRAAACLYRMFEARHRPAMPASYEAQARLDFDKAMEQVTSLTHDRWFRALAELVEAGLRTNAFAREAGEPVAIKIDPARLGYAPHPVPWREIFVHGVHVEGVHLRAGPVARGGLRYSDRPADFRTEVLELMATQVVKNGQIVPTGAKGGFVTRGGAGEEFVREQYRIFVRALLRLTDNLVHGEAEPPPGIRIHPDDMADPYLVVAADKGTARFSDIANEEARLAGFWLDDAFASGGRHGYDHKAIGITARGAWVCAAEHFRTLGVNAWRDAITVAGIGDMSGDVFGNGMLLNPNLRLVAAFNHRHIFLDPDPDPERAFAERKRLFEARQGWDGYDEALISDGGGVFERTAKRIPLADPVRRALGVEETALSGEALIRAILTAPVDMLYNGGIGTYVRATSETDAEVRDPANNAVRVTARELRCKVVCEGGNLGFTQAARLEYAAHGGLINTDSIDNSAGVDMSDHEVNLKILCSDVTGISLPAGRRNRLLKSLTEAVTGQCLRDNLHQSRALSLAEREAAAYPPRMQRLRDALMEEGRLDETTDPGMRDDATLALRPQLAVLLGHEKNRIHEQLSACCFEQQTGFRETLLEQYFPEAIRRRFRGAIPRHPLAADIIHTMAANHALNHLGLGSVHHLETLLDHPTGEIVQGLMAAEFMLDGAALREAIWAQVDDVDIACAMQRELQEHLMRFAEELLRLTPAADITREWMQRQRAGLRRFRRSLAARGIGGMESSRFLQLLKTVGQAGLATEHAAHLAAMPELAQTAAAIHIAGAEDTPLARCLKANQACLHLLPFREAEEQLRSATWGEAEAHALRREWLHRLAMLKREAMRQLLALRHRDLLRAGESLWGGHRHWAGIQSLRAEMESREDGGAAPMRLVLMLTRMETLISESATGR